MPERPDGSHQVLVAVAHGSADPRAAATITDLMAVVAERAAARGLNLPEVGTAYLGHAAPSLPHVMGAIESGRVTVLPLLLTAAYHSKTDIPRVLARLAGEFPLLRVSYGATLGPHPLLLHALDRRLAEADPQSHHDRGRTGVVLAAAGSADPEANATIASLAAQWQALAGWFAVRPASAALLSPLPPGALDAPPSLVAPSELLSPGDAAPFGSAALLSPLPPGALDAPPSLAAPSELLSPGDAAPFGSQDNHGMSAPDEAVTGLLRAGARRVLVATYLLAPGFFADRIRASALAAGAAAVSPALGARPEVAEVILDRYQEAASLRRRAA
jgi:sirohydrochlorin ferrochelatase